MSALPGGSWLTILVTADYNPIVHLNTIFSHPSALLKVTAASDAIQSHRDDLDVHIEELVEAQAKSNIDSVDRIQSAKIELGDLFRKIEDVRSRATQTERAITDMTADIKRLDATKRNLTLSMTALKRLQMLTTAYGQLWALGKSRDYRECAQLLQAVIQLMAYFRSYRSIDQIATLSRNVADLQRELQEQICEDFEITFAKGEVHQRRTTLAEACLVIDALGDNARSRLVIWYCNTQLREYRQLFRGNEEVRPGVAAIHAPVLASALMARRLGHWITSRGDTPGSSGCSRSTTMRIPPSFLSPGRSTRCSRIRSVKAPATTLKGSLPGPCVGWTARPSTSICSCPVCNRPWSLSSIWSKSFPPMFV